MKQEKTMDEQARWFLKSYLQHQLLLVYNQPDPSQDDLQNFLNHFSSTFRDLDLNSVIQQLYFLMHQTSDSSIVPPLIYAEIMNINAKIQENIIQKQKAEQFIQCKNNTSQCKKLKFENEQQKLQKKFNVQNKLPPTFQNQTQKNTYQTRRVIIEAYIQKNYGMTHLREFLMQHNLKIQLDYKEYAGIVNSLVTEGFRALERFLQQNCGIMVMSIKKAELRKLYPILLNLRQHVTPEDFKIYVIFLRSLYSLARPSTEVSALAVYNIYQKILKVLSIRLIQVQSSSIKSEQPNNLAAQCKNAKVFYIQGQYQSNKISTIKNWTKQNQEQLIDFYLEDQDMSRIRQKYRQKYGQITMFEKMNTLRSNLYQVIRKTLRRIQQICSLQPGQYSQEMRESINLKNQERYVQLVNTSPQFVKARISLCKYYKTRGPHLIYQIAKELSYALKQKSKKQDAMMPWSIQKLIEEIFLDAKQNRFMTIERLIIMKLVHCECKLSIRTCFAVKELYRRDLFQSKLLQMTQTQSLQLLVLLQMEPHISIEQPEQQQRSVQQGIKQLIQHWQISINLPYSRYLFALRFSEGQIHIQFQQQKTHLQLSSVIFI